MEILESLKRKNLIKIQILHMIIALLLSVLIYVLLLDKNQNFKEICDFLTKSTTDLDIYVIPLIFLIFAISGFFTTFIINRSIPAKIEEKPKKVHDNLPGKKDIEHKNRRMYLNLLSILQREGRLLDFFSEELSQFDDAQIGAAARGVHDSCSKVIKKYIEITPVIDDNEGEEITIDEDFDPDTIKLTGNVTGKPPFKGILKHKGWQAKKADLPKLSESVISKLIVPAEVEIK
ncbi:MAG: DUF2760 domain-containing protein [Deltaproteobacteria bacterium]|nr:DUF2760 domain-containing protein [Deltaproteobacteria bacterium]